MLSELHTIGRGKEARDQTEKEDQKRNRRRGERYEWSAIAYHSQHNAARYHWLANYRKCMAEPPSGLSWRWPKSQAMS
eukprot:5242694-Karenia_brevis.AAC.1